MPTKQIQPEASMPADTDRCRFDADIPPISNIRDIARQPAEPDSQDDELEAVQRLFGTNFVELAILYLADSPKRIAALREAAISADMGRMIGIAHSLSGSCASMGAIRLSNLCRELDIRCRADLLEDFGPTIDAIAAEYARIETKLRLMMQSAAV